MRDASRRRRRRAALLPAVLLVLLVAGYGTADVMDVVPGVLTARPPAPAPEPYPSVSLPATPEAEEAAVRGPDAEAPQVDPDVIAASVASLLDSAAVGAGAGVMVADVLTGATLAGHGAEQGQIPASTTKLLTATAAIAAAGPDHTFQTRVVEDGDGGLVLVGGGDLALAAGAGDPAAVVGHGGLADLAAATAQALLADGRTSVSLSLDTSYYTGAPLAPRWDEIDLAAGDAMNMAPLAIEIGRLDGTRAREADPAGAVVAAFTTALEANGVEVVGEVGVAVASPDAVEVASVSSAPLADIVAYCLVHSENILAEGLGRLVAHEVGGEPSFAGGGVAVGQALADLGIDTQDLRLDDSAGLSSTNRIAPTTLVQTLLTVAVSPELGAVARGLPVAGLEGTLSTRLTEAPAAGLVAAKTGTLRGVVSLAGYVTTADGRLLAFAALADEVPAGATLAARQAVDRWAQSLAACGC